MATKKAVHKSNGQAHFPIGTRHSYAPSLATLTRAPLAVNGQDKATTKAKREFIYGLLKEAGGKGISWPAIQEALVTKFGSAPKKRGILYSLLGGIQWHKETGQKGVVIYRLGRAGRKGK